MSLKARIEAVIYAAEEPVTLAQLAALFGGEVEEQARGTRDEALAGGETDAGTEARADSSAPLRNDNQEEIGGSDDAPAESANALQADEKQEQKRQRDAIKAVVDELIADYAAEGEQARGMEIREVAGGYRMATRPEYHDAVRGFIKSLKPPLKLSLPALETLAVIAYKQPVTAPEIGEIRGVDSGGTLGSLLARKLIATAGRKQVIGRPILYKTTKEFLVRFGLKDVNELPSLEEFEKMAAEIGEVEDSAPSEQDNLAFARAEADVPVEDPREPATTIAEQDADAEETDSLAVEVEDGQRQP